MTFKSRCAQHFQVPSCLVSSYLPKVPRASAYLFLCAIVNPPCVVQHVLLPLLLIIQEHRVLWKDMTLHLYTAIDCYAWGQSEHESTYMMLAYVSLPSSMIIHVQR